MTCFRLCAATAPRGSSNGTAREDDVDLLENGEKEERQDLLVCKVTVIEKIMSKAQRHFWGVDRPTYAGVKTMLVW